MNFTNICRKYEAEEGPSTTSGGCMLQRFPAGLLETFVGAWHEEAERFQVGSGPK